MANGLFNLKQVMQGIQQGGWNGQKPPAVEYLVVAGGGGGGNGGGGGGAGGLIQGIDPIPNGQALLVTIGSGGAGSTSAGTAGSSGQNSVFGSIIATGGGGGGTFNSGATTGNSGLSGGSGGGGASAYTSIVGGSAGQGTSGQGNVGGISDGSVGQPYAGAGGGGAGTKGLNGIGSNGPAGNGGAGIASAISGTVTAYAGGGGGGASGSGVTTSSTGGAGGGGSLSGAYGSTGGNGTANTGGGAAAGWGGNGGTGGSGIVIVSYPDVYAAAASTTGSPTVSTSGSGSISFNGSNQYLNYAAQTPFAFGTGDFTIEFWVYSPSGLAAGPSYIDFRGTNVALGPTIYNNNGILTYYAGADRITATYSTLNTWAHIAVCRIGTATKMYLNGTQVGSTYTDTNNYTVGTGGPYIGQNGASGGYFTGYMSNIRFVKGVGVYTGTFTPPTAPLTITQSAGTNIAAITGTQTSLLLNTVSGAYAADSSTNSYAPANTIAVTPTWNALSPFTVTGYKNRVYTWTSSGSITF